MPRGAKKVILAVKNLTLAYPEGAVIKDANFELLDGDFACVVGANGSGKSTLVKGILGLMRPAKGSVKYRGGLKKSECGYLPQEMRAEKGFPVTVMEVVMTGALGRMGPRWFYGETERMRGREVLEMLDIAELAQQNFARLSGGQRQKVLLARALIATDRLLILDEPSSNLDQPSKKDFYRILQDLNKNRGYTIIMITHDLDIEDLIGNKVIALLDGKATMYGQKAYVRRFQK